MSGERRRNRWHPEAFVIERLGAEITTLAAHLSAAECRHARIARDREAFRGGDSSLTGSYRLPPEDAAGFMAAIDAAAQ